MEGLGVNTLEQITNEVDLFALIWQQTCVFNEFYREFAPQASLLPDEPIEFSFKGVDQLLLDLND